MSDWTAGYVADIGYTFGYYNELNPLRIKLSFLNAGLVFPEIGTACELGFGQGISANMHAAASVTSWYGTDFNPAQAGFAQEIAAISGADAHLFDDTFADFANRPDLPDFDFIGLHGIWSWINDENRTVIVDFIRRKLKVGGVVYIGYNTQPGWAAMVPMRDLLTQHSEVMGTVGKGILPRIEDALDFAEKLLATNPSYSRANTQVAERVKKLKEQDRSYLAHEYFNRDWVPMSFSRLAEWMAPTKLDFATSAHFFDHVDAINLTAEQQSFLKEIPDVMFRETVRDFMVNQQFRKDYWVKGARKLNPLERNEALREVKVVLVQPRADVSFKIMGNLGEMTLHEAIYNPILDALANHVPQSLGQLESLVSAKGVVLAQLVEAVILLAGNNSLLSVQSDEAISKAKPLTNRLNATLCDKARGSATVSYLASPVTGGGISVDRFQQIFLHARRNGKKEPIEWAQYTWAVLSEQGRGVIKDGITLTTAEENLAELISRAQDFAQKQLPILDALGIG